MSRALQRLLVAYLLSLSLLVVPKRLPRKHAKGAEWRGDRPAFVRSLRRGQWADLNFTVSADLTAWAGHYGDAWRDNFHYIYDPKLRHTRRMTKRELHAPKSWWHDEAIRRWRRGPSIDSERPYTYRELAKIAVDEGSHIVGELKDLHFMRKDVAQRIVDDAIAVGHPPIFMCMLRQRFGASYHIAEEKVSAIKSAGGGIGIICGRNALGVSNRARRRRVVATWVVKPDAFW